jgi:membrane-associated protein
MSPRPARNAASSTARAPAQPRRVLVAAGVVAMALYAAVTAKLIAPPDPEAALTGLSDTLGAWTYALVAALAFLETGAFVGLVVPGETAIVLGGVLAARGEVELSAILPLAWLAATLGDLASFTLGQRLGRRFLVTHGPRLGITEPRLDRVERLFGRHGPSAILVGRFVGIARAVAPLLAGASRLRLRAFLPWSLLGTAAWTTTFTLAGFAFQHSFSAAAEAFTHGALALAVMVTVALAWRAHAHARHHPTSTLSRGLADARRQDTAERHHELRKPRHPAARRSS